MTFATVGGRLPIMADLLTTTELAALVSKMAKRRVSPRRLFQIAADREIVAARRIGRAHLWTASTARKLLPRASGPAGWKDPPKALRRR